MTALVRAMIVVLACAIASPSLAGIPDWAKAVTQSAPPVPDGMPDWPMRVLLDDTHIAVSDNGATWRVRRRKVVQMLSNRVDETAVEFFAFDDTSKVKKAKGWHVPPGESAERNSGGAIELSLSDEFLTDQRARVVALGGVRKGSLVVYEFEAESHPYTLTASESFYDNVPVSLARFSIELSPGWKLKYAWLPEAGPDPVRDAGTWAFELRDLVPMRPEELGDDPVELSPRLVIALQPGESTPAGAPTFSDWNAVGRWYQDLAKGREATSPGIQAAVTQALEKAGPQPLDRIRALSLLVRDRVRYVAREVGIGGYQPHYASDVFSQLHGDCKDKGTLLRAALASAGFTSYPILIHATNPSTVSPDVPGPGAFDHFVIGVVWPKGTPVPEAAASAIVDAGDVGTLLVIDATDERTWPGTLPDNLAGRTGLAVVDGRGVLVTLPRGNPQWHRITRTVKAKIAADQSVAIERVSRLYGGPAAEARHANAMSFKDHREAVERSLRETWPGAEITTYDVAPEDGDGAYVETVTLALPPDASALQEHVYWIFKGAPQDIDRVPLGKRLTAVRYPYPVLVRYEVRVEGFAESDTTPLAQQAAGEGWTVDTSFERAAGEIRGVWTAVLTRTRFEPAAFADLKRFWSAATKAAGPGLRIAP